MLLLFNCSFGQYDKYSIDHGKVKKSGRISLQERKEKWKEQRIEYKEGRKFYKDRRKTERKRKRYRRETQTKPVIKRMKRSEKVAKRNNKNKPNGPLYVRIKWALNKAYGRLH